jgi:hypothetical protein
MANEFGFHLPTHSSERESYSISYDEITKSAVIHVRGIRHNLVGPYENYAAAMRAARDLLQQKGLKLGHQADGRFVSGRRHG